MSAIGLKTPDKAAAQLHATVVSRCIAHNKEWTQAKKTKDERHFKEV